MALTPEVQSLIDILHEETRDEAWQARVQDSYEAAQTTLNMTDESVARAVLREVLRQNVDDAILDDVLDAAKADSAEAFAQNIHEKAQSWDGAEINPRLEIEIAKDPRQLGEEFNGAGAIGREDAQRRGEWRAFCINCYPEVIFRHARLGG